jgi:hypothetical protein
VRIGPLAFAEDFPWLAGIVFRELIHSPQYAYYVSKGLTQIDPSRSEIERRLFALDEYEAYTWTLHRGVELALSPAQRNEIRRRAVYALIEVADSKAQALAEKQEYNSARDELIRQFNAGPSGGRPGQPRPKALPCCTK